MASLFLKRISAGLLSALAMAPLSAFAQVQEPTQIFRFAPREDGRGLSFDQALNYCRTYQRLNDHLYYSVYCQFEEDRQVRVTWGLERQNDYQILGYRTTESFDRVWGVVTSTSEPVYATRSVPVVVPTEWRTRSIYSVTVYGHGDFRRLPWVTLIDSRQLGELGHHLALESRGQANLACQEDLLERRHGREQMRFRKARCQLEPVDGGFAYKIQVQSPFESEI